MTKQLLDLIRGLVRPTVTLLLVAAVVIMATRGQDIPEFLKDLTLAVIAFWFGQRTGGQPTRPT